jgi:hypothetical protein
MALIDKLTAIADGFRSSHGTTNKYSLDEMAVLAAEVVGSDPIIEPLTATENGTYTPPDGVDGYSPVTVNVAGGGGTGNVDPVASLEVRKTEESTSDGDVTYDDNFLLLDIYPKTNGTVTVTYGGLTKTVIDASGAEEPEPQQVAFGTFLGVSDSVETPESGTLTIDGDYRGYGQGLFTNNKSIVTTSQCITAVNNFGNIEMIPPYAFQFLEFESFVKLPSAVASIGEYAFSDGGVKVIIIGDNVSRIDNNALSGVGNIIMLNSVPPFLYGDPSFTGDCDIIVPIGAIDAYKAESSWNQYVDRIKEMIQ